MIAESFDVDDHIKRKIRYLWKNVHPFTFCAHGRLQSPVMVQYSSSSSSSSSSAFALAWRNYSPRSITPPRFYEHYCVPLRLGANWVYWPSNSVFNQDAILLPFLLILPVGTPKNPFGVLVFINFHHFPLLQKSRVMLLLLAQT
jgi:hypothetical protein